MDLQKTKLVALDMDGTLTQHRTPIEQANADALWRLKQRYDLALIGAGSCLRIHKQLNQFPMDVIGNYGMEWAQWDQEKNQLVITKRHQVSYTPAQRAQIEEKARHLRELLGYTRYAGEGMEFHDSGMLTFALLGTQAAIGDKLAFDPDKKKRLAGYEAVRQAFDRYTVFIGGSSSYDIVPKPYHKLHALQELGQAKGLTEEEVVFVGDDWAHGGNDEPVYRSGYPFIKITDYRQFPQLAARLL